MKNVCDFIGTVNLLEALENDAYERQGLNSRPTGAAYASAVLDIARDAVERGAFKKITPADLEELTADNYHAARKAAEILLDLERYAEG